MLLALHVGPARAGPSGSADRCCNRRPLRTRCRTRRIPKTAETCPPACPGANRGRGHVSNLGNWRP
eukprot:9978917-Lingulodinium_polyedra.AAC.2